MSGSKSVVHEANTLFLNLNGNLHAFPLLDWQRMPKFELLFPVVTGADVVTEANVVTLGDGAAVCVTIRVEICFSIQSTWSNTFV